MLQWITKLRSVKSQHMNDNVFKTTSSSGEVKTNVEKKAKETHTVALDIPTTNEIHDKDQQNKESLPDSPSATQLVNCFFEIIKIVF